MNPQPAPRGMSPRTFVTLLGVVAGIVGLVLLFTPVRADVAGSTVACGTALSASSAAVQKDSVASLTTAMEGGGVTHDTTFEDACASSRSGRTTVGCIVLALGVVALGAGRWVRWPGASASS